MLIPMLLVAIYTNALIFGPAFVIVLALCLALLIRFPSLRKWMGIAMVVSGVIELSLVPTWVFWLFFVGLFTIIIGTILAGIDFLTEKEGAWVGFIAIAVGALGILLFARDIWGFALVMLAFGTAGAANFLPENKRAKIGLVSATVGFAVILISMYTNFLALAFLVGFEVMFSGISVGVSGLPYWTQKHSGGNTARRLRKSIYALLAIVILSSTLVFSLRATHVLREELYDNWSYETTADTTIHGIITGIYLNYEVNCYNYSYHIFPALIIVNVTEVVKVGESWMNLTERSEQWINENMTVAYDKPDVPNLTIGQNVEANGYYDQPVEDIWSYSNKLVITTKINDSYIKPLQSAGFTGLP
jgi:hypothetical protein